MSMMGIDQVFAFFGHKNVRIMGEVACFVGAAYAVSSAHPFLTGLLGFAVGPVRLAYVVAGVLVLVGIGFHRKAL